MIWLALACSPPSTDPGPTPQSPSEPCGVEQTFVGDLFLSTEQEKADFAEAYCAIEGRLEIHGDPEGIAERLEWATTLDLEDATGPQQWTVFESGEVNIYDAVDGDFQFPSWVDGALGLHSDDRVTLEAPMLRDLAWIQVTGRLTGQSQHRISLPALERLDALFAHARLDMALPEDLPPLTLLSMSPDGYPFHTVETERLRLFGYGDSFPSYAFLCDHSAIDLAISDLEVFNDDCLLEMPKLEQLQISGGEFSGLRGTAQWPDGVSVDMGNTVSIPTFVVDGVHEMNLSIDSDSLHTVELPDLASGSVSVRGDLPVVELPRLTQASTLRVFGSVQAPMLASVQHLSLTGSITALGAFEEAETVYLNIDHTDMSQFEALRAVHEELSLMGRVEDVTHLHGLHAVGKLTIRHTNIPDAAIEALVEAIGEDNIGETDFAWNGG